MEEKKPITTHKNEALNLVLTEMRDILDDMEQESKFKFVQRLPLHLFEHHFLAYFKGEVTDPQEKNRLRNLWIDVAGHAGRPVEIFNIETNEVLFTIPAMADGTLIDLSKSEAISFAMRQYQYHSARSPQSGMNYLIKNTDKIAENIMVDDLAAKKAEGWKSFAIYYGLIKSSSDKTTEDNGQNQDDDFFTFGS